jgi:ribonuclease HI
MVRDPRAIRIYTDGSCYKNPGGAAGCAAMVHYPEDLQLPDEEIVDFGCAESSNNRMELMACVKALEWVRERRPWDGVERIQMVTDSLYVKENIFRARAWKRNGWRNRYGMPMANDDLWKRLISAHDKAGMRVDFEWEPGKRSPIGKVVDRAAKAAAQRGGPDVDRGYRPGAVSRTVLGGVAQLYPARGQVDVIRIGVKKVMHRGENKISFETFDEHKQAYVAKFYAFATPTMAANLHRSHGYRVHFNDDIHYPRILECVQEVPLSKLTASPKKDAKWT